MYLSLMIDVCRKWCAGNEECLTNCNWCIVKTKASAGDEIHASAKPKTYRTSLHEKWINTLNKYCMDGNDVEKG
jgi:hypothetical protein